MMKFHFYGIVVYRSNYMCIYVCTLRTLLSMNISWHFWCVTQLIDCSPWLSELLIFLRYSSIILVWIAIFCSAFSNVPLMPLPWCRWSCWKWKKCLKIENRYLTVFYDSGIGWDLTFNQFCLTPGFGFGWLSFFPSM